LAEKGKDSAIEEANNSFRMLNYFLIIIATTIFSFSFLVLNNREFEANLESTRLEIVFLVLVWAMLGFSIMLGAIQFFIENKFFKKWFNIHNNVLNKLNDFKENHSNKKKLYDMVDKEQKGMNTESNHLCIYLQMFLIFLSLILLIISIYQIIFN